MALTQLCPLRFNEMAARERPEKDARQMTDEQLLEIAEGGIAEAGKEGGTRCQGAQCAWWIGLDKAPKGGECAVTMIAKQGY